MQEINLYENNTVTVRHNDFADVHIPKLLSMVTKLDKLHNVTVTITNGS